MGMFSCAAYFTTAATSAVVRGADHPERSNLEETRVRRVHLQKQVVAAHVAVHQPTQVFLDSLTLGIQMIAGVRCIEARRR